MLENLLTVIFTSARILLHRQLTRKRGHWRTGQLGVLVDNKPSTRGLFGEYATTAFAFTLAHGVFVLALTLVASKRQGGDAEWAMSITQFRREPSGSR